MSAGNLPFPMDPHATPFNFYSPMEDEAARHHHHHLPQTHPMALYHPHMIMQMRRSFAVDPNQLSTSESPTNEDNNGETAGNHHYGHHPRLHHGCQIPQRSSPRFRIVPPPKDTKPIPASPTAMATTADNDTSMIPTSPISDTSIPTSPPPTAATQQQQHHQQPTQPTDSKPAKRPARTTTSKRAAQNRAAQRAFRERRGIYIKSLEQKAASYDTMALQLAEALARLETLQTVVDAMVVEREAWNKEREVWWREREEAVHVARGLAVECGVVRGENERLRGAVKNDAVSEGVQMDQDQDQETTGDHSKARGMVGSMLPGAPEAVAKLQQEMKLDVREWSVDSAPAEAKEGSSGLAESAE